MRTHFTAVAAATAAASLALLPACGKAGTHRATKRTAPAVTTTVAGAADDSTLDADSAAIDASLSSMDQDLDAADASAAAPEADPGQ